MYKVPLNFKIHSGDELLKLHFNKINTSGSLKVTNKSNDSQSFSGETLKDGIKNYIIEPNSFV